MLHEEALTGRVIGAAIEVHRQMGPGLLESAYEECLCHEFNLCGKSFQRQVGFPVVYKSMRLDCGYRTDLIAEGRIIVELKAVESLTDLHKAQLLTYLRISGLKIGLLFNFNTEVVKDSMVRLFCDAFLFLLRALRASVVNFGLESDK